LKYLEKGLKKCGKSNVKGSVKGVLREIEKVM